MRVWGVGLKIDDFRGVAWRGPGLRAPGQVMLKGWSVGPLPANPQMANLLLVNSRYQQIPGLADWIIADLPGLVNSDYFPTLRSLVAPTRGAGGYMPPNPP